MAAATSLELIAGVVASELEAQERRGDALDSKAGLVLGFAGVLVGLGTGHRANSVLDLLGFASAALAAVTALASLAARPFLTMDPTSLRVHYLGSPPAWTQLRMMDTRITSFRRTQHVLRRKGRLLRLAAIALAGSTVLTAVGATLP